MRLLWFTFVVCLGLTVGCGPGNGGGGTGGGSGPNAKRIFVTATTYDGNLGGLAGADSKCNTAATGANRGGTWKAWMSDQTTNAIDRINDVGPWVLMNGDRVFNNKANLATTPLTAPSMTEQGNYVNDRVWTGTDTGGTKGNTCMSWTDDSRAAPGMTGDCSSAAAWTNQVATAECDTFARIYCLEQ